MKLTRQVFGVRDAYDGAAHKAAEEQLAASVADGDVDGALRLDRVRRAVERVYEETGEG